MKIKLTKQILSVALAFVLLLSCKETTEPLPQLLAGFSSTSLGLTLTEEAGTVSVELSRTDAQATIITLMLGNEINAEYGVDYTTTPEAINGEITLEIQEGTTSAELVVNKLQNPEFEETKSFTVTLSEVSNNGDAGTNNILTVSFEENPVSAGAELQPEVGGPEQPNQVYIDLSRQTSTAISKDAWDLAISGGDDFRVTLNYATYAMAKVTAETDLANVTDALVNDEYKEDMVPGIPNNVDYIDDPAGDLTKTTIAEVSETAADNKVYVLNRGHLDTTPATERGYMKFKVMRTGNVFTIQYGEINDVDNFSTIEVTKNSEANFTYVSLDDGIVEVEPAKNDWDIVMTTFTSEFPNGDDIYSYKFPDYVLTNYGNVEATSVEVTESLTYENFTLDDISSITLEDNRLAIRNTWRGFDFATFSYFLKTDIFYVIKDTDGNNYKLKFTAMFNESGERGYPEFTYELLK